MVLLLFIDIWGNLLLRELPPYARHLYNRRLLATLLSNRVWFCPSAKAINGRETYERRAKEIAVTAGGTQPGAVN